MFKPVSPKVDFPKLEEEILKYWKENKIFEKSLKKEAPYGNWTFLDGPPFITGLPHYGSLLSSIPKDVFPRFKTMQGYKVRRVWGWDCHGLPAENKVEEKLNIKRKKDIENTIGVKKFIDECKLYVSEVSTEWEWYVDHIGRWVDFKNAYKTMDLSYMESVMWVFKQMYDKGLIYKGLRVTLYCPHCATPISNFEVAMDADNYKEIIDPATTYKYELKLKSQNSKVKTYILAWSTTPWNKIVTPALAVNPKLTYVKVRMGTENYILAKDTLKILSKKSHPEQSEGSLNDNNGKDYKILEEFKGEKLVGKKFIPHYDYYVIDKNKKAFEIIGRDFVTAEEGTGVVTIAAYGEEDLKAMKQKSIHIEMHLDEEGTIKRDVPKFGGMYYLKANKYVNEDLQKRGLVYKEYKYSHNVPLCWRCHTRLYYAPQNAWYVNVQILKDKMKKTNKQVNWFPSHFQEGRFLKSLESAPDWNISRNRYFGSPVPVWECECGERFVPGSIKELEEKSGRKIHDLHKPEIDEITIKCKKCGKKTYRVPEVLDSWIEAGSASFGERHYPFIHQNVKDFYPPDFIGEYTGQIRAWFYVLHVIANALELRDDGLNTLSKNVLVEGVILGTDGRKMSKNYGNYPDPKELLQKYGGDALRLYLLGSPVMNAEDILISEEQYRNQIKGMMLILWNSYSFFIMYANTVSWNCDVKLKTDELTILDKWILAKLTKLVLEVNKSLEKFDSITAIRLTEDFIINNFSTWYIRRSRDRVSVSSDNKDRNLALSVIYGVLVTLSKLLAPLTPFIAEEIFKNLTGEESVHLQNYPKGDKKLLDEKLIEDMDFVRKIVKIGHAKRKELGIKVRQPLAEFRIMNYELRITEELLELIKNELNVKKVEFNKGKGELAVEFDSKITDELKNEGEARDIVRKVQEERKRLGTKLDEKINITLMDWPREFEEEIKRRAVVNKIQKGDKFSVERA